MEVSPAELMDILNRIISRRRLLLCISYLSFFVSSWDKSLSTSVTPRFSFAVAAQNHCRKHMVPLKMPLKNEISQQKHWWVPREVVHWCISTRSCLWTLQDVIELTTLKSPEQPSTTWAMPTPATVVEADEPTSESVSLCDFCFAIYQKLTGERLLLFFRCWSEDGWFQHWVLQEHGGSHGCILFLSPFTQCS